MVKHHKAQNVEQKSKKRYARHERQTIDKYQAMMSQTETDNPKKLYF